MPRHECVQRAGADGSRRARPVRSGGLGRERGERSICHTGSLRAGVCARAEGERRCVDILTHLSLSDHSPRTSAVSADRIRHDPSALDRYSRRKRRAKRLREQHPLSSDFLALSGPVRLSDSVRPESFRTRLDAPRWPTFRSCVGGPPPRHLGPRRDRARRGPRRDDPRHRHQEPPPSRRTRCTRP